MIAFQHVSVKQTKPNGRPFLIEDANFTIEAGELFGVTGYEGAGKSTLMRTINGLIKPSRGEVLVDSQTIASMNQRELSVLRRKIGMVLPSPAMMVNMTIKDNISLPLFAAGIKDNEINSRIQELLALTGIEGLGNAYPDALTLEHQKRAAIARALATCPKILLCMEPASGLTASASEHILDLLDRLHKELNLTMVISTSDLHAIQRLCSRAAVLQDGKVIEIKDTYVLLSTPEHSFTKTYLAQQLSFELPPDVREHAVGTIVSIEYMGDPANEPVLYETAQRFGVEFNILQGRIEYIGGKPLGKMYVSFNAEPALMVSVLGYLKAHTYRAEVIQDV